MTLRVRNDRSALDTLCLDLHRRTEDSVGQAYRVNAVSALCMDILSREEHQHRKLKKAVRNGDDAVTVLFGDSLTLSITRTDFINGGLKSILDQSGGVYHALVEAGIVDSKMRMEKHSNVIWVFAEKGGSLMKLIRDIGNDIDQ